MELDNFDLIINLVAVGVGVSLVPQRSLALYARRHAIVRLPRPEDPFSPGDDVASSIQACEACRVGASPTHLITFIHAHGKVDEPLVCKTDTMGALPVGTSNFHSIQAELLRRAVGSRREFTAVRSTKSGGWISFIAAKASGEPSGS